MADILIRGMEMPKSCDECRLFNESWCMALGVENWRKSYNKPPEGGRLPDCPLVPLPEGHGDLIEKQAFIADIAGFIECITNVGVMVDGEMLWGKLLDALANAKTIVPAEGGPDNG